MEILTYGIFRCRIIICSETDSSIAYISLITMIHSLIKEIYAIVFGTNFVSNFIEAKKYIHPGFKLNGYIFVTIALREAVFRHAQVPFAAFELLAFLFD